MESGNPGFINSLITITAVATVAVASASTINEPSSSSPEHEPREESLLHPTAMAGSDLPPLAVVIYRLALVLLTAVPCYHFSERVCDDSLVNLAMRFN